MIDVLIIVRHKFWRYRHESGSVTFANYGVSLAGQGFDRTIILDPPKSEADFEWMRSQIETRRKWGGTVEYSRLDDKYENVFEMNLEELFA